MQFVATMDGASSGFVKSVFSALIKTSVEDLRKIDLICFGTTIDSNLASGIVKQTSKHLSMKIINAEIQEMWYSQLNGSSVLLFESAQQFRDIAPDIKWQSNPRMRFKHIVYSPNLTAKDVIESVQNGFSIDQVAFLMNETNDSIELATSFMFTEQACRQIQLKMINKFNGTALTWANNKFFPKKYKNMHNCSLSLRKTGLPSETPDFFPTLASKLNFTMKSEKLMGNLEILRGGDLYDLSFSMMREWKKGDELSHILSTSILTLRVFYIFPDGEPFTQFEKMFMMFDNDVWIGIGCTLLILLIAIQIIKQTSMKVQNFVSGRGVQTPTMNLLEVFLCGAQYKVPGRNFARYLLMLFVFWSLVIRTCYQSKLFELLQGDIRKSRIETLEDVADQNFTIIDEYRHVIIYQIIKIHEISQLILRFHLILKIFQTRLRRKL